MPSWKCPAKVARTVWVIGLGCRFPWTQGEEAGRKARQHDEPPNPLPKSDLGQGCSSCREYGARAAGETQAVRCLPEPH